MNAIIAVESQPIAIAAALIASKRAERSALADFAVYRDQLLAGSWSRDALVLPDGSVSYRAANTRTGGVDAAKLRRQLERASAMLGKLAIAVPGHAVDILAVQRLLTIPTKSDSTIGETIAVTVAP